MMPILSPGQIRDSEWQSDPSQGQDQIRVRLDALPGNTSSTPEDLKAQPTS